jgi:hypothetical protein
MAAATYSSDLIDIYMFESTTGVSAYGGGASGLGASPDYSIEGTNAVDKQVSAAEKGFMYTAASAFTIGPNDHFFIWVVCAVPGLVDTLNNRGIHVSIGDDTSNFMKFHVAGGDTKPRGGIAPYAVRYNTGTLANRRTPVGSPGATPDSIGGGANVTGTAKFSNFACDAARIGTGYDITGGTSPDAAATFSGIASNDESTAEGVFQTADGGYSVQGKIRVGNSGTECELTDENSNLLLIDTLDGIALTDFTEFLVADDLSIFTLTNVNFIALGTNNPGRLENLTPLITAQDETSYDNSPTTEGTFSGGTGHAATDVITLDDDWTTVTVDAVSSGVVTQFTVNSTKGRSATSGTAMTQSSTTGSGTGFSLTPDTDNILGAGTITFVNVGFIDFGDTILSSNDSLTNGRWIGCGQVTANGAVLTGNSFTGYEGTANTSYLIWDTNADPDGELDNCAFTKGTAATHAIEFGQNSPTTMTLRGIDFSGYNAADANDDSTFHFKRTSGSVTLNVVGCTGNFSYRTDGATITIVEDPVTLTVNCKDASTKDNIQTAHVFVKAGSTGPLPFKASVTITRVSTTATVSHTAHGLLNGQKVFIEGANETEYNGIKTISNVSANAYDYTVSGSPATPATGTITSTAVIISGTTDASGNITDTRTYGSNQSIDNVSKAAKSSAADIPKYKPSAISGTISSTAGLTVNLLMIRDE